MRIYSELSPTSSADRTLIEQQLRELCAWHEWSAEPQNINAAVVLQDAADAVGTG
jgi:hypothetical protein